MEWGAFEILAVIAMGVLGFLLFLSLFEPTLRYRVPKTPDEPLNSEKFTKIMAALADSGIYRDSSVEVLTNGEVYYPELIEVLKRARRSITIEAYIFQKGEVTRQIVDVLTERARAGVRVNMVIDAIGSFATWNSYLKDLRAAGAEIFWYHGFKWHQLPRLNSRTHREIVVVDCEIAFVGGPGFADHWLRPCGKLPRWRDTMFRVEGRAVAAIQATFLENYLEASGELLMSDEYFCFLSRPNDSPVLVVNSSVSTGQSTNARMLFQALMSCARERIEITTPYFLPDAGVRKELKRALRERSVKVRIICPGEHNDHRITRHTSRRLYGTLLRAGAEIYEYQPTMIHAKTMIIDGTWGVFGSTNFDHRSFSINDELNIATADPDVIARLREDFARDLQDSKQVTYSEWRKRSWFERGYESIGMLLERQQ
jgi:cardiolipin synthase